MVLRRCRKLLGDDTAARDAMHDVFVQVLSHADQLADQAPSSLLFRISTNVCLNRLRTRRRRPEDGDDVLAEIAEATDPAARSAAKAMLDALFRTEPDTTALIAVLHLVESGALDEPVGKSRHVATSMAWSFVRSRASRLRTPETLMPTSPATSSSVM